MRSLLLRTVVALAATSVAAAPAFATITTTNVTSPADHSFLLYDHSLNNKLSASGTTDSTATFSDHVDLVCANPDSSQTAAMNLVISPMQTFGTTAGDLGALQGMTCRLRAIPSGASPSDLSPFTGPLLAVSLSNPNDIPSGPNAGKLYNFDSFGQTFSASARLDSVGSGCGLTAYPLLNADGGQVGGADAWPFECVGGLSYDPTSFAGGSDIVVDGKYGWGPGAAFGLWVNANQNAGYQGLTYSMTLDPATGKVTIHETDPIVRCLPEPNTWPANGTSCSSYESAGVQVERTIVQDHDGRLVRFSDRWSSTDGTAHALQLHYLQQANNYPDPNEWRFPGSAAYTTPANGTDTVLPAGPGTIYLKDSASADGDVDHYQAIITYARTPTIVHFYDYAEASLRYTATVPATGSYAVDFAYAVGTHTADLDPLAADAEAPYRPSLTVLAPNDGATVTSPDLAVSGTVTDQLGITSLTVNGLERPLTAEGTWAQKLTLGPGPNTITVVATNGFGNVTQRTLTVTYTPPPAPAGAGLQPAAKDTTPPVLTVVAKAVQRLKAVLKSGVKATVGCSEACTVRATLVLDAKTAKKLRLARTVVIGRGSAKLTAAGKAKLAVKLTKKAKKALARAKAVKVTLRATATDPAGNASKAVVRKLRLKR